MSKIAAKLAALSVIALLSVGLAACSAGPIGGPASPNVSDNDSKSETNGNDGNDEANDGRAFDSSDDAVITAILAALSKADRAEWQGSNLMIYFTEGSVDDVAASIGCLAAQTIIADEETSFMVYPDGTFDCSTMF